MFVKKMSCLLLALGICMMLGSVAATEVVPSVPSMRDYTKN